MKSRPYADARRGILDGGEKRFWVENNGAGFSMQYANKLFAVFQRLHGPAEFDGSSVLLAIG